MVIRHDQAAADGAGACERCGAADGWRVDALDATLCEPCFEAVVEA